MKGIRILAACGLAMAALFAADPALAQSQTMTVPEIRRCLCQEQEIARRRLQVSELQNVLSARNAELLRFSQEIMRARANTNLNDQASMEYMRQLLARQGQLRDSVRNEVGRPYQEALSLLTREINDYNQACTTRPRIRAALDEAKRNLQCPAP